ncbi:MAG: hypothetical protein ACE3L7_04575 [Candidatus Pristimantibacillus sp.]
MSRIRENTVTRCSLVVTLVDVWTRKKPSAQDIQVSLAEYSSPPIRKPDGSFLFLDLQLQTCHLKIVSNIYMPQLIPIELHKLDPLSPVIVIPLLPSSSYSNPPGSTGIKFRLINSYGDPLPQALIQAYASEDSAYRGRISQETTSSDNQTLKIGSLQGKIFAGEVFLLRDKSKEEFIRIAAVTADDRVRLEQPITSIYNRGAVVLPAVMTYSARDGTVILPFRGMLPPLFEVRVNVTSVQSSVSESWTVRAGELLVVPELIIPE